MKREEKKDEKTEKKRWEEKRREERGKRNQTIEDISDAKRDGTSNDKEFQTA